MLWTLVRAGIAAAVAVAVIPAMAEGQEAEEDNPFEGLEALKDMDLHELERFDEYIEGTTAAEDEAAEPTPVTDESVAAPFEDAAPIGEPPAAAIEPPAIGGGAGEFVATLDDDITVRSLPATGTVEPSGGSKRGLALVLAIAGAGAACVFAAGRLRTARAAH